MNSAYARHVLALLAIPPCTCGAPGVAYLHGEIHCGRHTIELLESEAS